MGLFQLFPSLTKTFEIERMVTTSKELLIEAQSQRRRAVCPRCGQVSQRVHSHYVRHRLRAALCGSARAVGAACPAFSLPEPQLSPLHLCRAIGGPRRALGAAHPWAEASPGGGGSGARGPSRSALGATAGVAGGQCLDPLAGAAAKEDAPRAAVRVLGIDDWAWRRGHRYGTILVDLERGCLVDLLAEYSEEAISAWLSQQRQVQVVVRDRSKIGIKAINRGAPQAVQVADRFHLLQNLTDQLTQGFQRHPPLPDSREPPAADSPPALPARTASATSQEQSFAQMQEWRAQGWSIRGIAHQLGFSRSTVARWLVQGCPKASWGRVRRHRGAASSPRRLSPRQAAGLFVRPACRLEAEPREQVARLLEERGDLEPIYQLAQRFVRLMEERRVEELAPWLEEASRCAWSQLRQLAHGLQSDLVAVRAALLLPYSNGPVEGQVTRLKLLKRHMYGRAKVDLLRHRLIA